MSNILTELRGQNDIDALRAIADNAHTLESRGLISNVYAEVRERATSANLRFTTTQMHDAIEQSNREYHAMAFVRAELRAMVEEEEIADKPHGIYSRRNGCQTLLGKYGSFADAYARIKAEYDGWLIGDGLSAFNDLIGRFTFTNEHGTMWIFVAPCD